MCLKGWRSLPTVTVGLGIGEIRLEEPTRVWGPLLVAFRGKNDPWCSLMKSRWWLRPFKGSVLIWRVSFNSLQPRLGKTFVDLSIFALNAHALSCQEAPSVCHLFYFQLKVDGVPIKALSFRLMGSVEHMESVVTTKQHFLLLLNQDGRDSCSKLKAIRQADWTICWMGAYLDPCHVCHWSFWHLHMCVVLWVLPPTCRTM